MTVERARWELVFELTIRARRIQFRDLGCDYLSSSMLDKMRRALFGNYGEYGLIDSCKSEDEERKLIIDTIVRHENTLKEGD